MSYISTLPLLRLRTGATVNPLDIPFRVEPVALIMMLDAGCETAPA